MSEKPSFLAELKRCNVCKVAGDAATNALQRLLQIPAGLNVANLKFDRRRDPLRKDPRFQKLCEEGNR